MESQPVEHYVDNYEAGKCTIDSLLEISRHISETIKARGELVSASGKAADNAKIALDRGMGAERELAISVPEVEAREPHRARAFATDDVGAAIDEVIYIWHLVLVLFDDEVESFGVES